MAHDKDEKALRHGKDEIGSSSFVGRGGHGGGHGGHGGGRFHGGRGGRGWGGVVYSDYVDPFWSPVYTMAPPPADDGEQERVDALRAEYRAALARGDKQTAAALGRRILSLTT